MRRGAGILRWMNRSDAGREDEVGSWEEAGGTFFAILKGDGRAGVTTLSAACKAGEKGEGKVTPAVTPMTANLINQKQPSN